MSESDKTIGVSAAVVVNTSVEVAKEVVEEVKEVGNKNMEAILSMVSLIIIIYFGWYGWNLSKTNNQLIVGLTGIVFGINVGTFVSAILLQLLGYGNMLMMK